MTVTEIAPVATNHETYIQGEQLYTSFSHSLRLTVAVERKYASMVLGIEPEKLSDIRGNFSFQQLSSITNRLRDLYSGVDERSAKYNDLINKALAHNSAGDPDKYLVLGNKNVADMCKQLARSGMLSLFTQHRVDEARAQKHYARNLPGHGHRNVATDGLRRSLNQAASVDDLIAFNHLARDLITSPIGRVLNIDREKMGEILKIAMLGDSARAEEVEHGVALEVAAKRLMDKEVGEHSIAFGTLEQDKKGGDLVLYPRTTHEVFIDVKQTPPNNVRRTMNENEMNAPGFRWSGTHAASIWLGYGAGISRHYKLPSEFVDTLNRFLREARPQAAIA